MSEGVLPHEAPVRSRNRTATELRTDVATLPSKVETPAKKEDKR
jgi:hypothetical protein